MVSDSKECSLSAQCRVKLNPPCDGCSFHYFDLYARDRAKDSTIGTLRDRYFNLIQERRKSTGGRIALDKVLREWFEKKPRWQRLESRDLTDDIIVDGCNIPFKVKCDWGAPDHMDTRIVECSMKPEVRFGYREEAAADVLA